jgi:hypothetical protein
MRSQAAADAKCAYERERTAAYRDFYQELKAIGKLAVTQAISHKPFREAVADIGKPPSESSPAPPSPFERVLFGLYERILIAYKQSLVDAHLPTSTIIRRLTQCAESTYQEIYIARIEEFAQRAGFCAEKAFPEFYLRLMPENARGQTSTLFRQLEDEVLAIEKEEPTLEIQLEHRVQHLLPAVKKAFETYGGQVFAPDQPSARSQSAKAPLTAALADPKATSRSESAGRPSNVKPGLTARLKDAQEVSSIDHEPESAAHATARPSSDEAAVQHAAQHSERTNESADSLPAYWKNPTPLHYFDRWPLLQLEPDAIARIKRGLLKVHADFLEGKTGDAPEVYCWRSAYDVFAVEFDKARLLTEDLLTKEIPAMVADAGASGRWKWGRNSLEGPEGQFTERLGSEFYPGAIHRYFMKVLKGRTTEWQGALIQALAASSAGKESAVRQPASPVLTEPPAVQVVAKQSLSPPGLEASEPASRLVPQENRTESHVEQAPRKKRGRPTKIPDERKLQASQVRGDKARARILYDTPYPSVQQVKNVPSILRHFARTRQKSE